MTSKIAQVELVTLIKAAQSWQMLYTELCKHTDPGRLFEIFCKQYYLNEPSVCLEYEHVWLFNEVPEKVRAQLNLGTIDHGADLILKDKEGAYTFVQCKFRSDQTSTLSWSKDKLTNLFAEGGHADYFVVFTNASGIDKHSLSKKNVKAVTYQDLMELHETTFNRISKSILNKNTPITIKTPHPYQSSAIRDVLKGFKKHSRGQLILPCGAGKTLTALWIKEELESKRTLVLVPSLALLRQIKKEWSANLGRYVPYMCVCSEGDIDGGSDHIAEHVYNIQGFVSTESTEIKSFLEKHSEVIIYCTYQSLEKVRQAANELQHGFDLAICDEAHKTAGSRRSHFGLVHDEDQIKIARRLYMTATPCITGEVLKKSLDSETFSLIFDMGNPDVYGPEFHRMTFKEAIDQNILCNYKIAAIGISNAELKEAIDQRVYVDTNVTIDEIANNFALYKFMNEHNANHAITFHSSVKKAQAFAIRHTNDYENEVDAYHVNGKLSTGKRARIMDDFKKSSKAVMTNARCLTEGVDVPAIDVVYFCDPKNSKIDIVQAAGRALRQAEGKKFGYIVVPIYHDRKETLDDTIESGAFKNLVSVVRALSDHDERLSEEIRRIKLGLGPRKKGSLRISIDKPLDLIVMQGFEIDLEKDLFCQLIDKINVRCQSQLTEELIISLVKGFFEKNKRYPMRNDGGLGLQFGETWSKIDTGLREGLRGLPGGSSLPRLLQEKFGVKESIELNLLIKLMVAYREKNGKYPTATSGYIPEMPGETWGSMESALTKGLRGLPKSSLAKLRQEHLGERNRKILPKISIEKIKFWAKSHFERAGEWPTKKSGGILESPGETWNKIDSALQKGLRGLPGGYTLSQLLTKEFGVRNEKYLTDLDINVIKKLIVEYRNTNGVFPNSKSGNIPELPGETWGTVDSALRRRVRNLPKSSLPQLCEEFGGINHYNLPNITNEELKNWINQHHDEHGKWPTEKSGDIKYAPYKITWGAVNQALIKGCRGFLGGASLPKFIGSNFGVRNPKDLPPLSIKTIKKWLVEYVERTGERPNRESGFIPGTSGETWGGLISAFTRGARGLPKGLSISLLWKEIQSEKIF